MAGRRDDAPWIHAEDRRAWGDWLAQRHETADGAWLVTWKKPTGRPAPSYDDAVEEALRFGWIDPPSQGQRRPPSLP